MMDEKTVQQIRYLQKMYPDKRSMVMGALWAVQRHNGGSLKKEDLETIAELLELGPVEVQSAASFYTMYNVEAPVGRYHIQVCRSISCTLLEAERIVAHLEHSLGINSGQVSADGRFSLTTVECLGSCGTAPMMQVNDDYYEDLTPDKVDRILEGLD